MFMSAKVRGTISRTIMGANGLELRFVMRSDPRYLQVVRGAVGSLAAAIGWDESDCMAITMALDEALANVIRHEYHNRHDGEVEFLFR